ncbi:hypothetical protein RGE_16430 [Rubrivivax gelatinosus IL144]|uniref:Uncharacterized protein n=1 Tax=Rubrivivax gelatinosus (strain NBRC 100245 / IL144) TaxID=983917 RepID=I0HPP7_RUBGI|nr:hypothetical protein RGE_16430 [Rubrivivax gelatinosus IL144]
MCVPKVVARAVRRPGVTTLDERTGGRKVLHPSRHTLKVRLGQAGVPPKY